MLKCKTYTLDKYRFTFIAVAENMKFIPVFTKYSNDLSPPESYTRYFLIQKSDISDIDIRWGWGVGKSSDIRGGGSKVHFWR